MKHLSLYEDLRPFEVKGKIVYLHIDRGKYLVDFYDQLSKLDLSYEELVDSGIWKYVTNGDKRRVIGDTYSFVSKYNHVKVREVVECIGHEIVCINDKAGTYGGKPTITEGKLYNLIGYNGETEMIKIRNDNGRVVSISPSRFCKTKMSIDISKYNL